MKWSCEGSCSIQMEVQGVHQHGGNVESSVEEKEKDSAGGGAKRKTGELISKWRF